MFEKMNIKKGRYDEELIYKLKRGTYEVLLIGIFIAL
jgi:hypothetical protein